jgi:hypothetical protein
VGQNPVSAAKPKDLRKFFGKSKVWLFAFCGLCVLKCSSDAVGLPCGGHMVSINEELKAAKAAINSLSTTPLSKSVFLAALNKANHAAILNLSSGGALNEARGNIGIVLSNLMFGQKLFSSLSGELNFEKSVSTTV